MVAGTGEAPSGVVEYDRDNLPKIIAERLLVTSWGDHRIEQYRLKPHGASFRATMEPVVTGGEDFRPVGIAIAPDGSVYISDWVDKSYTLHGKGRIWRLRQVDMNVVARLDPNGPAAWRIGCECTDSGRPYGEDRWATCTRLFCIMIRPTCVRWA